MASVSALCKQKFLKQWSFALTNTLIPCSTLAQLFSFPFRLGLHLPLLYMGGL